MQPLCFNFFHCFDTAGYLGNTMTSAHENNSYPKFLLWNEHTHNRFTALLEFVRDHPGEQVPER